MSTRQPEWKENIGSISATAWKNERQSPRGGTFEQTTVQIERRYRDAQGTWKSSSAFDLNELFKLQALTRRLIDRMVDDGNRQHQAAEASA